MAMGLHDNDVAFFLAADTRELYQEVSCTHAAATMLWNPCMLVISLLTSLLACTLSMTQAFKLANNANMHVLEQNT